MRVLQKSGLVVLMMLMFILTISVVSATYERIHINMTETVYMNVTYGDTFTQTNAMTETIQFCRIDGFINVSNRDVASDSVDFGDITIQLGQTGNVLGIDNHSGRLGTVTGDNNTGYELHIPELRHGNWSQFNYTINCTGSSSRVRAPLDLETNYSASNTGYTTKVLAGQDFIVNQSARNDLGLGVPITNINISILAQPVIWNGSAENFTLAGVNQGGDNDSVSTITNALYYWVVNSTGDLNDGEMEWISYNVTAPDNVPSSDSYMALFESLTYEVAFLASNLSLESVIAVGDIDINVGKRITQPADDNNNTNASWAVDSNVTVPTNVSYNLTSVTLWVTENVSPISTNVTPFGDANDMLNTTIPYNDVINMTDSWTNSSWNFVYTDGSTNSSSRPPIVWMKPFFHLLPDGTQIQNGSLTRSGNDYYMKYIYVVNGYWLQIDKNITAVDDDTYLINSTVTNIGNAWTPENLVVTVYDFVPVEFTMRDLNYTAGRNASSQSIANLTLVSSEFNGTSYQWAIPWIPGGRNSSLGPPSTAENSSWNVWYYVDGIGDYDVSELYIVGLDPRKVDGAGAHQGISLISGFGSSSREAFYLLVVFFLIVINVVNFVMTRRINDKLNSHKK